MVLPEKAKQTPSVPVLNKHFPTPRWTCLKRLSGLHLPRFGITVFLLLDGFASPSKHCLPRFRIRVFPSPKIQSVCGALFRNIWLNLSRSHCWETSSIRHPEEAPLCHYTPPQGGRWLVHPHNKSWHKNDAFSGIINDKYLRKLWILTTASVE